MYLHTIRSADISDAEALLKIYAPYVDKTAITFEYDIPSADEFSARIRETLRKYPYIVAEANGRILGYAYAGVFKNRAAYDHCVEVSVYVAEDAHGLGIGRALYEALEARLENMGILNLYACVAATDKEDEFLSNASIYFHEAMGYRTVGHFTRCGYKFDRWYNMVWMEKIIGKHRCSE